MRRMINVVIEMAPIPEEWKRIEVLKKEQYVLFHDYTSHRMPYHKDH